MRNLEILFDLDETLVDLLTKWIYYYNNKHGTDYTREDFAPGGRLGYDEDLGDDWIEFLRIPGFHADLPWLESITPSVLRRLKNAGHTILIGSAPVTWESPRDKYSWCHTHLRIPGLIDSMDEVYLCRGKHRIRADVIVDDRPWKFVGAHEHVLVYSQPWNMDYEGGIRCANILDVEEAIHDIAEHADVQDGTQARIAGRPRGAVNLPWTRCLRPGGSW